MSAATARRWNSSLCCLNCFTNLFMRASRPLSLLYSTMRTTYPRALLGAVRFWTMPEVAQPLRREGIGSRALTASFNSGDPPSLLGADPPLRKFTVGVRDGSLVGARRAIPEHFHKLAANGAL